MVNVLNSEFFWGILVGSALTIIGAYISFFLQARRQKQIIKRFCYDSITNLSEYIQNMDAHRDRARQIHDEFIALIEAEIQTIMRNKEQMVYIDSEALRRRLRDFFVTTAVQLALVKNNLNRFYQADKLAKSATDESTQKLADQEANLTLADAQKACDKLAALRHDSKELLAALR